MPRHTSPLAALLLALLPVPPRASLPAQEARTDSLLTVEKYLDYQTVADPRISPDGRQVVYTRRWVNRIEDRWESELWLSNSDGSHARRLGKGSGAVWSPDGTRIAFLAEGEPRGTQIHVRWMDAEGATSQVAHTNEAPADLAWSPDGRWISFSSFVPKQPVWRIDLPEAPQGAKWTPAPRIVQSLHFRQDRRGFLEPGARHLFIVSAEGGAVRQLTTGDWSVGGRFDGLDGTVDYTWLPDGRSIVIEAFRDSTADLNYRDSHLYTLDVASGVLAPLTRQPGSWGAPVASPDGRWIAYTGHPRTRDSYRSAALYVMDAGGGGERLLSGSLDRDVDTPRWTPDGKGVYFTAEDHGARNVYLASLDGGVRAVTTGDHQLTLASLARSGAAVGMLATAHRPADVAAYTLGRSAPARPERITHVNDDLLARVRLGEVERIRYRSSGGAEIDGWLVKPPGFDAHRRYPLILEIHGGPHGAYNGAFNFGFQNFAANGFLVLYTNPRGSTGYGSAFGNAIMNAYPSVDYEDLMAGVDTILGRGYADPARMYVGGCSGGGVLSSWVIGHTTRFAAAAVRCPVINWISMAGQTDIPLFTYNFFEKPFWEDPRRWLEQSPLMYVGRVTTPTLVMTGELDRRTPIAQSEEYYAALKVRGVPSTLLRFEGEFHGTSSKPSNFMRTQLYMMSWYNRWPAARSAAPAAAAGRP